MPDWVGILLFVAVPALLAAGAHAIVRRLLPADRLIPHHDVAGFLVAIVGVLYAVVLGFMVVTVWSSFNSVQNDADAEAFGVGDAYGFAGTLPEPYKTKVRTDLTNYANEVRTVEWAQLKDGRSDPKARAYLLQAFRDLVTVPPAKGQTFGAALRQETLVQNLVSSLRQVWDHRRQRLVESNDHLPPALMLAIVLGGLMVLAFVFLFGIENEILQLTMTAIVAGCIGLLFGVIIEFNQPYGGLIQVNPDAWNYVVHQNHLTASR